MATPRASGIAVAIVAGLLLTGCVGMQVPRSNPASAAPATAGPRWWSMSGWDLSEVDTAREASYLSAAEKDMILAMNMARTNPRRYAKEVVEPVLGFFSGSVLRMPGDRTGVRTNEGARPVAELIRHLNSSPSVPPLSPSEGLTRAARDHARDQGKSGATGHYGADGSGPAVRVRRYGVSGGTVAETIEYGSTDRFRAALGLLIDDGVPDRGHRLGILDAAVLKTGTAIGPHPRFGSLAVVDFAASYLEGSRGRILVKVSFDEWRSSAIDTARGISGMAPIEQDIVLGLNIARTDPKGFTERIVAPLTALLIEENVTIRGPGGAMEGGKGQFLAVDAEHRIFMGSASSLRNALASFPARKPAPALQVVPALNEAAAKGWSFLVESNLLAAAQFDSVTEHHVQTSVTKADRTLLSSDDITRAQVVAYILGAVGSGREAVLSSGGNAIGLASRTRFNSDGFPIGEEVVYVAHKK